MDTYELATVGFCSGKIIKETSKAMQLYEKILLEKSGSVFTAEARKRFRELRGDNLNLQ